MASAYFDTSVFLAIFNREPNGPKIKALLRELRRNKVRIYTSIVTVQEVSVLSFRKGRIADDNYVKVGKLARIETITREIALTAAKLEAQMKDIHASGVSDTERMEDNRRRKWDCFHIATAMCLGCDTLYAADPKLLKRKKQLSISSIHFSEPEPRSPELFPPPPSI